MPSRVFVVNEPLKRLADSGERGRAIDLRPAQEFGELVFLSAPGEPPTDPEAWLTQMRDMLQTFRPQTDYLLPVGHPSLIVAAAAILGGMMMASNILKGIIDAPNDVPLSILVWRGRAGGYTPVRLPLFTQPKNQTKPATPQSHGEPAYNEKI